MISSVIQYVMQWYCKHATVHENRACDCICDRCGKDLGFIGSLDRTKHAISNFNGD